jgi:hypothetical protein
MAALSFHQDLLTARATRTALSPVTPAPWTLRRTPRLREPSRGSSVHWKPDQRALSRPRPNRRRLSLRTLTHPRPSQGSLTLLTWRQEPSSSDTEADFTPSAPSLEETEEFGRKEIGLSGRARWQVRKLLAVLTRMRKDLPPSARIEAVRRLGWHLGPGLEASRASAGDSGPEPTQVPEGGDQIRKFLEELQQKYKESEERYRTERDEAFRSDDELAHAKEQLAAERTAELEKRTRWLSSGSWPSPHDSAYCGVR